MNARDIARQLLDRNPPTQHALFRLIEAGALSRSAERAIGIEVFHVTAAFPRFLAALAARIETHERRMPVVANLLCEHGGSAPHSAHVFSYRRFLFDLGIAPEAIDASRPGLCAVVYTRALLDLCAQQALPEARAALAIVEDIVARVSPLLANHARTRSASVDAGAHFALHAELDQEHADESYAETELDFAAAPEAVQRGFELGLYYQMRLYSDLLDAQRSTNGLNQGTSGGETFAMLDAHSSSFRRLKSEVTCSK
ncbi:MAG: iron-containing redox enzyme family protein [Polyangiaceae bacterium]